MKRGDSMPVPTPSMEDYIERIYNLIHLKGYARVSDIAEDLLVHPSSVTKMVQKLDRDGYLDYEKYRGFILTKKGNKIGDGRATSELQSRGHLVCRLLL